ncbi:MAG: hypothetical protein ACOYOQ_15140 [Microthrixaceae bacterium]
MLVNDLVLKQHFPGVVSGKLSDFAGPIYFPLLLVSVAEVLRWAVRCRPWELPPVATLITALVVGVVFVLIKVWEPAADLYRPGVAAALWPPRALGSLALGHGVPPLRPITLYQDRWDLLGLVVLPVPWWVARQVNRG